MRTEASAALVAACVLLAVAAGCGSSAHSGSGSGASSRPAATGTAASGGVKVTTTPSYGSPAASAAAQSGVVHVAYRNITIRPDTLRVKVGATVVWTNYDPLEHNVTSQTGPLHFASKNIREGQTLCM